MVEDLIGLILRSQAPTLRRKATGAVLEGAALGMAGLAAGFLLLGLFLWLASHMAPWLAAMIVALAATVAAVVLMLIGRAFMRRRDRAARAPLAEFERIAGAMASGEHRPKEGDGPAMVAAALAAGIAFGRSMGR